MRYLVVREGPAVVERGLTRRASAGRRAGAGAGLRVERRELTDAEAAAAARDEPGADYVLAIPFMLIAPVDEAPPAEATPWGVEAIGAPASGCTGRGVTVAVLDTGIDRAHAAFQHLALGDDDLCDFTVDPDGIPGTAVDADGHGTHVAATLFGGTVDGHRLGVAPGVRRALIGKVLGPGGATTDAIYGGIAWALREHADVICLSLGIDFPAAVERIAQKERLPREFAESRAFEAVRDNIRLFDRQAGVVDALDRRRRGALLVAATGNSSRRREDPRYTMAAMSPSTADGFLGVGAVGRTGRAEAPYEVAPFSNTGGQLAGPGVGILSARAGGGLIARSGTSMAVPHVAGAAALWIERQLGGATQRPAGWAEDVRLALLGAARPLAGLARRDVGRGLVQAPAGQAR